MLSGTGHLGVSSVGPGIEADVPFGFVLTQDILRLYESASLTFIVGSSK